MKTLIATLVLCSACASAPAPRPTVVHRSPPKFLVVGSDKDQRAAAQKHCGDQSWSLVARREAKLVSDGSESYVVCSGYE
jgi:hypothetical protein